MRTQVLPSSIGFSQNSIKKSFTRGDLVHDVIDDINNGTLRLDGFLPIDVASAGGKYFSGNNRTLYVCRVLQRKGKISTIPVRIVPFIRIKRKMTTTNDGRRIAMRNGGIVRPHGVDKLGSWCIETNDVNDDRFDDPYDYAYHEDSDDDIHYRDDSDDSYEDHQDDDNISDSYEDDVYDDDSDDDSDDSFSDDDNDDDSDDSYEDHQDDDSYEDDVYDDDNDDDSDDSFSDDDSDDSFSDDDSDDSFSDDDSDDSFSDDDNDDAYDDY